MRRNRKKVREEAGERKRRENEKKMREGKE